MSHIKIARVPDESTDGYCIDVDYVHVDKRSRRVIYENETEDSVDIFVVPHKDVYTGMDEEYVLDRLRRAAKTVREQGENP